VCFNWEIVYEKWPVICETHYEDKKDGKIDRHDGCPSYPCCDLSPTGCIIEMGIDNVEWFGHKD